MNQNQGSNRWNDQTEKEIEKLDEANKEEEQRIRNLENKTLQNVNLYFIFQAIVLASTTTTTATTASCRNWWIPFMLSLFAAITNFSSFCSAVTKVLSSRERLDQNKSDLVVMKLHQVTKFQIEQVLPGSTLNHQGCEVVRSKVGSVKRRKRQLVVYSSIGFFVGFTVVLMYGCYSMLCHPGNRKCVKLC